MEEYSLKVYAFYPEEDRLNFYDALEKEKKKGNLR